MSNKPESEKSGSRTNNIALVLAVLSFLVSFVTFYFSFLHSGKLVIYEPTGFCIVRGYENLGFKSDHLVIPFVLENTGKGTKVFQQPTLSLKEKTGGHELKYRLTGFIRDLSRDSMDKAYEIGFSKHIPENSIVQYVFVFHIENWWDSTKPEYSEFHFEGGQEWEISLDYFNNGKAETWHVANNNVFFTMPVYSTIDKLEYGGDYNSDCFSLK